MNCLKTLILLIGLFLFSITGQAQQTNFLDHLRIGFGGGANMAHISALEPYNVFEDLTGAEYENSYSGMLENIGNQYFVQVEWYNKFLVVAVKPGTYTFRFNKNNSVIFTDETIEQQTAYLLRYLSVPVEIRYNVDLQRFRPYAGLTASYSHLLGSNDASNQSFIRPKFTAGAVAGLYIDLNYIILDLNLGYLRGLHNIASKSERYATGRGSTFAQDDILLNNLQLSLSLLFSLQKQRRTGAVECYY